MGTVNTTEHLSVLTTEQGEALHAYAQWAGLDWQQLLLRDWMRAGSDFPGEFACLQQLRNQFGPSWVRLVPRTFYLDEGAGSIT